MIYNRAQEFYKRKGKRKCAYDLMKKHQCFRSMNIKLLHEWLRDLAEKNKNNPDFYQINDSSPEINEEEYSGTYLHVLYLYIVKLLVVY